MDKRIEADYCIEIEFKKDSERPSRVFRTMYELIETFQGIDRSFVQSIDNKIETVLLLEDIEAGSVRSWLRNVLMAIEDDALKTIDWKKAVGKYLIEAKYYLVDFLSERTAIGGIGEVKQLEAKIQKLAEETDVKWIPAYKPVPKREILEAIQGISTNLSHLTREDKATYITQEGKVPFNLQFSVAPESIEELLLEETITSKNEMILKVKKPDYLGDSMWEFRHGGRIITAKILHKEWLKDFQERKYPIQPGDSLRAIVQTNHKYDSDGELLVTNYELIEIVEVMPLSKNEQTALFNIPETNADESEDANR
jgi:hypothetical protein